MDVSYGFAYFPKGDSCPLQKVMDDLVSSPKGSGCQGEFRLNPSSLGVTISHHALDQRGPKIDKDPDKDLDLDSWTNHLKPSFMIF